MVAKEIRVLFTTPLLEFGDAANEVLRRGWTARRSDQHSVTFSNSFESEELFEAALDEVRSALGPSRYSKIEFGPLSQTA